MRVNVRIKEGERERVQAYEGVCIARSGGGLQENFTVRKICFGEGVERVFPVMSPMIESIEVKRRGVVRRAKLYYLRDRRGKSARIAERATGGSRDTDSERKVCPPVRRSAGASGSGRGAPVVREAADQPVEHQRACGGWP